MGVSSSSFRDTPYTRGFVFAGLEFHAWHQFTILSGQHAYIELRTKAQRLIHSLDRMIVPTDAPINIYLYEAPTVYVAGTLAIQTRSENRNLTKTPTAELYYNATYTSGGILISQDFIPIGSGSTTAAFTNIEGVERILKKDTTYIMDIHNGSNTTITCQFLYDWYESSN